VLRSSSSWDVPAADGRPRTMIVATPYREGAALATAREAAKESVLERFYTSLYTGGLLERLPPRLGGRARTESMRRAFQEIPSEVVATRGSGAEALSVLVRRTPLPRDWASGLMYFAKARFDAGVAHRLAHDDSEIVFGMFASSSRSFAAAKKAGKTTVLNFVNSHPHIHNTLLRELAGAPPDSHELLPEWVVAAVDRELDLADLVLVPSRFVVRQLLNRGVAAERLRLIPYGVDLSVFAARPGLRKAREALQLRCLFVGHISYRKGVRFLVEAAARLDPDSFRFDLVGPMVSPEVLNGAPASVQWHGAVAHEQLREIMHAADVCVLPSVEDSYGLVALEAMACGLPVIVSANCGVSESVSEGVAGLIVPAADPDALANALAGLRDDPELRATLGFEASRTARSGPSWEEYGREVLRVCGLLPSTAAAAP
jgi:glycosyltransferase involved in cell wall biosynthesis